MKECPQCNRTFDDSWRVCLFCEVNLKRVGEGLQEEDKGWDQFPGNKFLIVVFSLFLMLLAPIIIIIIYLTYFQAFDFETEKHKEKQLEEVVIFEKKEGGKEEEYGR